MQDEGKLPLEQGIGGVVVAPILRYLNYSGTYGIFRDADEGVRDIKRRLIKQGTRKALLYGEGYG